MLLFCIKIAAVNYLEVFVRIVLFIEFKVSTAVISVMLCVPPCAWYPVIFLEPFWIISGTVCAEHLLNLFSMFSVCGMQTLRQILCW